VRFVETCCTLFRLVPTITLPFGLLVDSVAQACRHALRTFASIEPTPDALSAWVVRDYCRTLVGPRKHWPALLEASGGVLSAQRALALAERAARDPAADFVAHMPARVHVARIYDRNCSCGFGVIDVLDTPLEARVLSLLLADVLMHPEDYGERDVFVRHRSGTQARVTSLSALRKPKIG
jgi:hypothetical protein